MRSSLSRVAATILVALLVLACASAPSPTALPTSTPVPSPFPTSSPSAVNPGGARIAAGGDHTCALTSGGGVKCWGANSAGQVGNGTTTDSNVPVDVSGLASEVSAIAAGGYHTCALTGDGGVKCWGANRAGQLGNGSTINSNVPINVVGLAGGVSAIAARNEHSCALLRAGGVKCWGGNASGQLGSGSTTNSDIPVDVLGLATGVSAIAAGYDHTCALMSGGGVKCWGANESGQLGNDSRISSSVPVDVVGLVSSASAIAAGGQHTCALTPGGSVRCWGSNSTVPVQVSGLASGILAIAAGGGFTCVLGSGGGARCWGQNWAGQLGNGSTTDSSVPVDVAGLTNGVREIAAGGLHACAFLTGGGIKCWGKDNDYAYLGNGSTTGSTVPVDVDLEAPSTSIESPYLSPAPMSVSLPVRRSAREIGEQVLIAPGPGGTLFVAIPGSGGSVLLALLDTTGRPRQGWPVILDGATSCTQLLPVEDGSVRVLCTPEELNRELNNGSRAFAFDSTGRLLAGWPVDIWGYFVTGRVVGDDLTLYTARSLTDVEIEGQPSSDGGLVTVAADGVLVDGARVTQFEHCCMWAVGPDGIAHGAAAVSGPGGAPTDASRITAVDMAGIRVGWPVSFEGITSVPAFGPGRRVVLSVGSNARRTTRVLVFDPDGQAAAAISAELPILTAEIVTLDGPYECGLPIPPPPLVARDGTLFVFSDIDTPVVALDASLEVMGGWPYQPATRLIRRDPGHPGGELSCPSLASPAVGPDNTLYLPLQARDATVGGSIDAVGPDGRVRPGWPLDLGRAGSEFWSVVVGSDGTAYALAIEPEAGDRSSATILAIAPDSTVLYTTTIIEP